MTDQQPFPPDWVGNVDPNDPRLGDGLDVWQPTAGLRARAVELLHYYVARSPQTQRVLIDVARDTSREGNWLPLLVALLEQFAVTAIGAQGEALTVRRLAGDVAAARADALDEAGAR
jgi:hypothetical protein